MADADAASTPGVASIRRSLRALLADGGELAAARMELFALDLRELALRVVFAVLTALLIVVSLLIALIAGLAALLFAFGIEHALAVTLATLAVGLVGAAIGWGVLKRLIDPRDPPFSATLAEFRRDHEAFRESR